MKTRWLAGALGALVAAGSLYHADLLRAAATPNPMADSPESVRRGAALWELDCAACHGPTGRGDGPVTTALRKHPKDLTKIARPPIFPDGVLAYRIAHGGEVMPAWQGVLNNDDIWDLVSFIRAQRH